MRHRSQYLADRLEQGARNLVALARALSDTEWNTRLPHDGRSVGTVIHHVATVYPIEISLAQKIAHGDPITGVVPKDIDVMNAGHAAENPSPAKAATIALLERNAAMASSAIRAMTDEELDRAEPASLYAEAPVTAQFVLEDHAVRHSYHHFAGIKRALAK
jgi:hypothetical protein